MIRPIASFDVVGTKLARSSVFVTALLVCLAWGAAPAEAAANVLLVGVEVDDAATGNGDNELEPGETVDLKLELWNDGTTAATSVFGILQVEHVQAVLLDDTATWADLAPQGSPVFTDAPHFQVSLPAAMVCGTEVFFTLRVIAAEGSFSHSFSVKIGQRIDHDMMHDSIRRFTEQEATFWGVDPNDRLGWSSDAVADVNGDGFDDLILAAPAADSIGNTRPGIAGEIYLIYGKSAQLTDTDLLTSPAGVARFWGAEAGDRLGLSVASGDVNGDGFDDLILAAPAADSIGNTRSLAGEVYLIYGKSAQWTDTDLLTPPAGVARFWGAEAGDLLGVSVASGDVNGDGFDDLILGAHEGDSVGNTRSLAGEVYLIYGKSALWTDTDLLTPPAGVARLWGADSGDRLGNSVGSGDVNGDGFDDLILAAPAAYSIGNTRPGAGEVYLVYGKSTQWADTDLLTPPAGVARFWGADESLAYSVASGDVNGDGFDDLILAAPAAYSIGNTRPIAGEVYLIYGTSAQWIDTDLLTPPAGVARFWGADAPDLLGASVASGDVNGDGFDDLILGAYQADSVGNTRPIAGEVYLIYGRSAQWIDTDLLTPPAGVARFWGADASGDRLGWSVAGGDVNGDGFDDLILGAYQGNSVGNTRPEAGEVYLWYGKPTDTYVLREETALFIDASDGTPLPLGCDDCSLAVNLPFDFPFYAETFSSIHVSSNGFLSFVPIVDLNSFIPFCMPDRGDHNVMVAPLWTDLNPGAGAAGSGVFTKEEGTYPYRRFTIEWKHVPHYPAIGAATFEVTLFETTGQILIQYADVTFGDPAHDSGQSAVVGVENRTGAHGVTYSCTVNNLLTTSTALRYSPTTPLVDERAEHGEGLWTAPPGTGSLWHLQSFPTCGPNAHTGTTGWYFGDTSFCGNGINNEGALQMPTVPDFPADALLSFWSRHQSEPGFDFANVQLSTTGTGGLYSNILGVTDNTNAWRYAGVTDLSSSPGETVDLQFHFSSDVSVWLLGWMVDDIQLTGCDAQDVSMSSAHAVVYGEAATYCEGSSRATLDSLGSFCGGGTPSYQWKENGVPIPGATGPTYDVPGSHPAGVFDFTVEVSCPGGATAESAPVTITIEAAPGAVGETLDVVDLNGQTELHFTWADIASATSYVVVQDLVPNGSFGAQTGTSSSGAIGLTVPMPGGEIDYFLVAGAGPCGTGPLK